MFVVMDIFAVIMANASNPTGGVMVTSAVLMAQTKRIVGAFSMSLSVKILENAFP